MLKFLISTSNGRLHAACNYNVTTLVRIQVVIFMGVHLHEFIGGTEGMCLLKAYSVTQNSAKMHQNTSFPHTKKTETQSPLLRSIPR